MFKSKSNYKKPLLLLLVAVCCLMIIGASHLLLPPADTPDNLKLLLLDPDADEPVFKITSQLSYSNETLNDWTDTLNNSDSSSGTEDINLVIQLDSDLSDFSTLISDLWKIEPYFSHFSLSVLPGEKMTDQLYLNQCQQLFDALHNDSFTNFSLIAYPPTSNKLSLYNVDFINAVGTVLQSEGDLTHLEKVYKYFINKKELVVRDNIISFYEKEPQVAAQEINKLYHLLAVKYPAVHTIFSPYVEAPYNLADEYILNRADSNFYLFYTIYSRLLEKTWLTSQDTAVTSISPYISLNSYDELPNSEALEIILSPDQALIKEISNYKKSTGESPYLIFKWNNEYLTVTATYPYAITQNILDTPNGVSRIAAILQDTSLNTLNTYSMDLTVKHSVQTERAKRINTPGVSAPAVNTSKNISNGYIPILMYHTVTDTVAAAEQNSCVETTVFDSQMKGLLEAGYTPINFYNLTQYVDGKVALPEKPVLITMDDGYLNNYTHAYPVYKKYQIQATLFISPYYVQKENTERHFGWKAAREMEESGLIDIQAHGYDHTPFPYLSLKDLKHHITLAQGMIEMNLGPRDVSVVACPQFRNTRFTRRLLTDLGVDFQITKLAKKGTVLIPPILKRINVPNTMSPNELIAAIESLTN